MWLSQLFYSMRTEKLNSILTVHAWHTKIRKPESTIYAPLHHTKGTSSQSIVIQTQNSQVGIAENLSIAMFLNQLMGSFCWLASCFRYIWRHHRNLKIALNCGTYKITHMTENKFENSHSEEQTVPKSTKDCI